MAGDSVPRPAHHLAAGLDDLDRVQAGERGLYQATLIPSHPTVGNFAYVFTQVPFVRYIINSAVVAAVVTIVALLFHSMAGYALARLRFPGRDLIFTTIFATLLVSVPVILVPVSWWPSSCTC